jgi:hypothetical protein
MNIVKYVESIAFDAAKGWRGIVDKYEINHARSSSPDVLRSLK